MEILQMEHPVFIVPGIGNSGPLHWQSLWQAAHPDWRRLSVDDWDRVECDDWVSRIERQLPSNGAEPVIAAHSLGCLAVAHWAARFGRPIRGALLVAVPEHAAPAFPREDTSGFEPLPNKRLPFPTIVVASSNDPYGSQQHARACAAAWGSEFVDVGERGHINAASHLGDWPDGIRLLERLMSASRD
jgi:predicted alpha/beta hydrolase family esterase